MIMFQKKNVYSQKLNQKNIKMKARTTLAAIALIVNGLLFDANAQQLPQDPEIVTGKLPNGLTYIIRHNEYPKDRADFYIAQKVGAILEEDNQNGLAHFLEHMAFNGTKNFPDKGIINYLQSVGCRFGSELNAYTSIDETVYHFHNVPTTRESVIDSALLILHDWSGFISLESAEIDKERGVIREEWRTSSSASRRTYFKHIRNTMPGSQYAKRDVIGDTAVINNFKYDELRAYYHKWYRPDLQGIIVIGDVDANKVAEKIEKLWEDIPAQENPAERVIYTIDNNTEIITSVVTDKELTSTSFEIQFRIDRAPAEVRNTAAYFATQLAVNTISQSMRERFNDIVKKADSPIMNGQCYYGNEIKTKDVFTISVTAKKGMAKEAYTLLLDEAEKLRRYGITESELERAQTNTLKSYENRFNARAKRQTDEFQDYIYNFLEDETITSIEFDYDLVQKIMPQINTQMTNALVQNLMQPKAILRASAPTDEPIPTDAEMLAEYNSVKDKELAAYEEFDYNKPLVAQAPQAGTLVKTTENALWGADEWLLSNGVRVFVLPTNYADNEVVMQGFSLGGYSRMAPEYAVTATAINGLIPEYGKGEYSATELRKVLTGKSASVSSNIRLYSENLSGQSNTKDIETMLQLTYLSFGKPREDRNAFDAYMNRMKSQLITRASSPDASFSDTVNYIIRGGNPYLPMVRLDNIDKVDFEKSLEIYADRFSNAADFQFFIVGDFDKETIKPLVLTWLGGLPTTDKRENYIFRNSKYHNDFTKIFEHEMTTKKTSSIVYYSGDMAYSRTTELTLKMLSELLNLRYLETMREDEGGTYGVGCGGAIDNVEGMYQLFMQFDTDPNRYEDLAPIIGRELKKVADEGPIAADLAKIKENMHKSRKDQLQQNRMWLSLLTRKTIYDIDEYTDFDKQVDEIGDEDIKKIAQIICNGARLTVTMNPEN